ncbi:uncharacterized protein LOC121516497 [Xyrichtys novacula]|uniref:Uncharacterized protein LOC121516497 n=1 Tax=Xyrichtys novacula TaxID=13765 RepID=A0AAV1FD79_XYRNO|nr:uncharacterized protein LOC121516497 [Xyrichtys novacula]
MKMLLIVFLSLLMLRLSRCTDDEHYETKTVSVGDDVTLTCPRKNPLLNSGQLFWFRVVSGDLPELLGGTYDFDYEVVNKTPHFTTKQEPETFVLIINKTQLRDTGLYFCIRQELLNVILLKGTFLRIKGPGPDIISVVQDILSNPARPWDSKTLQCSVLSDKSSKTCPDKPRAFWFRSGSDESRPSVVYTHGNKSDGCEESPENPSLQRCVYSFSKTVSSSDDETVYCAVVACGEILFGNGTKLISEGNGNDELLYIALYLLSAAVATCMIVIAFLIYTIKTRAPCNSNKTFSNNNQSYSENHSSLLNNRSCFWFDFITAADDERRNAAKASADRQSRQRDDSSLVYAAPTFSKKKPCKGERRNKKRAEEEIVYSGVRAAVAKSSK